MPVRYNVIFPMTLRLKLHIHLLNLLSTVNTRYLPLTVIYASSRFHASSLLWGARPLFLLAMTCHDTSILRGILTLCLKVREAGIKKRINYIAKWFSGVFFIHMLNKNGFRRPSGGPQHAFGACCGGHNTARGVCCNFGGSGVQVFRVQL